MCVELVVGVIVAFVLISADGASVAGIEGSTGLKGGDVRSIVVVFLIALGDTTGTGVGDVIDEGEDTADEVLMSFVRIDAGMGLGPDFNEANAGGRGKGRFGGAGRRVGVAVREVPWTETDRGRLG